MTTSRLYKLRFGVPISSGIKVTICHRFHRSRNNEQVAGWYRKHKSPAVNDGN
jgi:hypothetical protein